MEDTGDEFEEFRSRSYRGGIALTTPNIGCHKSMVDLHLYSTENQPIIRCGSAYFNSKTREKKQNTGTYLVPDNIGNTQTSNLNPPSKTDRLYGSSSQLLSSSRLSSDNDLRCGVENDNDEDNTTSTTMRPRVYTMPPTTTKVGLLQQRSAPSHFGGRVRSFTLKRGKVREQTVDSLSLSKVSVTESLDGSCSSISSCPIKDCSRILIHGSIGVGKCSLIRSFGSNKENINAWASTGN